MRGPVEGQIKELIMEMTHRQPEKRIKIDAVCLKLEGTYYRSGFYQDRINDRYAFDFLYPAKYQRPCYLQNKLFINIHEFIYFMRFQCEDAPQINTLC